MIEGIRVLMDPSAGSNVGFRSVNMASYLKKMTRIKRAGSHQWKKTYPVKNQHVEAIGNEKSKI